METILDLYLEILCLLTGETFTAVKSSNLFAIMAPSHHFVIPERPNKEKILQLINKILELLTGESGVLRRFMVRDEEEIKVNVEEDGDTQELGHSEGHGELYKAAMMEDQPTDGSRNLPEGSPRPQYSGKSIEKEELTAQYHQSTEERKMDQHRGHVMETILHLSLEILCLLTGEAFTAVKSGDLFTIVVPARHFVIPERTNQEKILELTNKITELLTGEIGNCNTEVREEEHEEELVELVYSEGHMVKYSTVMMEKQLTDGPRIALEKPCRPLCSQDSIAENRTAPSHHGETLNIDSKAEAAAQLVMGDRGSTEESEVGIIQERDSSADIHTARELDAKRSMEGNVTCKVFILQITSPVTVTFHQGSPSLSITGVGNGAPSPAQQSDLVKSDAGGSDEKKFHCTECGKSCKSEANFQRHLRIHSGERPFPCSKCGKRFRQREHLLKHLRSHSDERPYTCSECGKTFRDTYKLKIHTKFHTGEDLHTCSECGKQFGDRATLTLHQMKHTGEKPYSCPECEKQYAKRYQYLQHLKCHTGEKPYTCPECGKQFADKSRLNAHERIHTGDKPHRCSECGKSFMFKSYLAIHQRVHTGATSCVCSECGQVFPRKEKLGEHKKEHLAG